jgi:hypothetical protein
LEQRLDNDDPAWHAFGLNLPSDPFISKVPAKPGSARRLPGGILPKSSEKADQSVACFRRSAVKRQLSSSRQLLNKDPKRPFDFDSLIR